MLINTKVMMVGLIRCDNVRCVSVTDCGAPPAISHAAVLAPVTTYPSQATYTCTAGYWFSTNVFTATVSCSANGVWTAVSGHCTGTHSCVALSSYTNRTTSQQYVWA
jgi:hypothetical protein